MTALKRIFISSVQKELELERAAIATLVTTDPFLIQHCVPLLFEKEPPPARPASQPYLEALRQCSVYLLLLDKQYGRLDGELSATHHEYRLAQKLRLPTIIFIKGSTDSDQARSPEARAFLQEVKQDGHTYKRFHDREDLRPEVLRALLHTLDTEFQITATNAEISESETLIEAASSFEQTVLPSLVAKNVDIAAIVAFGGAAGVVLPASGGAAAWEFLQSRGLAIRNSHTGSFSVTAATWLLFSPRPADRFPQCEILADAYDDTRISGRPKGQISINAPIPSALEQALAFVDQHTFHPRRVVGLNNLRLDEYPTAALREALVNAVAHRNYEDVARKVLLRVFNDRIEIASPGFPPRPLTLAKLRKGNYRPCSRNPIIAQTLAMLGVMEQRGSGFARIRDAMLDHGLEAPSFEQQDGYFVVTLPGPAGDHQRLRVPANLAGPITPAIETRLNKRQKQIVSRVIAEGSVTRGWCVTEFKIANDTAGRDLKALTQLGVLKAEGKGRATRYIANSTGIRPTS